MINFLIGLKLSNSTIKSMLEICPNIKEMSRKEAEQKVFILKKLNCSKEEIRNIISSNPNYLDRTNGEILDLIKKLVDSNFKTINILLDSNPYILNLEPFEIDEYIKKRLENNETLEDIIDDLDSNPYLFSEM